jgi:hypothetical protein
MLNLFLGFLLVTLMSIGFFQFKRQKETVSEVEHSEVFPETDPVKIIHHERYGMFGKGERIMHEFWSHQRNKIQKELEK